MVDDGKTTPNTASDTRAESHKRKRRKPDSVVVGGNYTGFSSEYAENMSRIRQAHLRMCRELRIQSRKRSYLFRYMKKQGYFVHSNRMETRVDDDGKKVVIKHEDPKYPMRMTFFNGGKCHFPHSAWGGVFDARACDVVSGNLLYDNDFAMSEEGIKLFFELDYRSKDVEPSDGEILKHVRACQSVVRSYFRANPDLDLSCWVLLSTPKPKYVKDEVHPLISMGCHIVFKSIVVNCEQGKQLCHSANLKLETEFGARNLVDCCYKRNVTSLRPIYCRKLEVCMSCLNNDDLRLNCEDCLCRGKIPSGSIYTVSYLIDSDGKNVYDDASVMKEVVTRNLPMVLAATSIVPLEVGSFTPFYNVPKSEPMYIPIQLRSVHKDDKQKDFVYRKDRRMISMRKKGTCRHVTDERVLELIRALIRGTHPYYDNDQMLLSNVTHNSASIFVDLKGTGRCFCRIHDIEGKNHNSNRVYFRIDKKRRNITQHCYDGDCRALLLDQDVRKRVTSAISGYMFARIFQPDTKVDDVSQTARRKPTKHDNMSDFLDMFGT